MVWLNRHSFKTWAFSWDFNCFDCLLHKWIFTSSKKNLISHIIWTSHSQTDYLFPVRQEVVTQHQLKTNNPPVNITQWPWTLFYLAHSLKKELQIEKHKYFNFKQTKRLPRDLRHPKSSGATHQQGSQTLSGHISIHIYSSCTSRFLGNIYDLYVFQRVAGCHVCLHHIIEMSVSHFAEAKLSFLSSKFHQNSAVFLAFWTCFLNLCLNPTQTLRHRRVLSGLPWASTFNSNTNINQS